MSPGLGSIDMVVLDVDGVVVNVENSYRRAIRETIQHLFDHGVEDRSIQLLKDAGGFNNDWDVTYALALYKLALGEGYQTSVEAWAEKIEAKGGGLRGAKIVIDNSLDTVELGRVYEDWNPERMKEVFQQLYLGNQLYEKIENKSAKLDTSGFILSEPIILTEEVREHLQSRYHFGILTGRPKIEAQIALRRARIELADSMVYTMEDWRFSKPDPTALIELAKKADASDIVFVGDTLDDVKTALNANEGDPSRSYYGVGVLTGGLTGEQGREKYMEEGAQEVLETVNDLPARIS